MARTFFAAAVTLVSTTTSILVAPACSGDTQPSEGASSGGADAAAPATSSSSSPTGDVDAAPNAIPVECLTGTAVEAEDNGTPDQATPLGQQLAMCGTLSSGSDVDYSKFTTPAGKKLELFQAVIEGAVDFDLIVNGKTLKPSDVKSFEAGSYVIKAYSKDGKPAKYRYRIQYEL